MSVETPASYPINVLLTNRRCVVIGGGTVADRKVQGLLAAGGRITIVAPDISPELRRRAAGGVVTIIERPYRRTDLDGAWLAIACTDDAAVNRFYDLALRLFNRHPWTARHRPTRAILHRKLQAQALAFIRSMSDHLFPFGR